MVQQFVGGFTYNRGVKRYFDTRMDRPLSAIIETGRYIGHGLHPIRCLEAVFLGVALTQRLAGVDRFTLRFHSRVSNEQAEYRHIVLGIKVNEPGAPSKWGAIGLSREPDLMTKEARFTTLSALIRDYIDSYAGHGHELLSVAVGLPIRHDEWGAAPPCWGFTKVLHLGETKWAEAAKRLDAHSTAAPGLVCRRASLLAPSFSCIHIFVSLADGARVWQVGLWERNAVLPSFCGMDGMDRLVGLLQSGPEEHLKAGILKPEAGPRQGFPARGDRLAADRLAAGVSPVRGPPRKMRVLCESDRSVLPTPPHVHSCLVPSPPPPPAPHPS
jgi:hypothetical protein